MYLELSLLSLHLALGFSFVAYEMFQGFDSPLSTYLSHGHGGNSTEQKDKVSLNTTTEPTPAYPPLKTTLPPILPIPNVKMKCPEEEGPSNIGPYEVPTQRDLVSLITNTLTNAFNTYHMKALNFLKDITEATKGTMAIENECHGAGTDKRKYRMCVRQISKKCELITKTLVTSLERKRENVSNFTEETICNIKLMKADPVQLIKIIAMENSSLDFALPGFLRLLGSCAVYCKVSREGPLIYKKPIRHLTDQQLVVKHLLTKKNYIELLQNP